MSDFSLLVKEHITNNFANLNTHFNERVEFYEGFAIFIMAYYEESKDVTVLD